MGMAKICRGYSFPISSSLSLERQGEASLSLILPILQMKKLGFKRPIFSQVPLNRWWTWDSNSQSLFSLVLPVALFLTSLPRNAFFFFSKFLH